MQFKFWLVAKNVLSVIDDNNFDDEELCLEAKDILWKNIFSGLMKKYVDEEALKREDDNRKKYINGILPLPKKNKQAYNAVLSGEFNDKYTDIFKTKYDFLKKNVGTEVFTLCNNLTNIVYLSTNLNSEQKKKICSLTAKDNINYVLKRIISNPNNEEKYLLKVLKILAYSTQYTDEYEKQDLLVNYVIGDLNNYFTNVEDFLQTLSKTLEIKSKIYLSGMRGSGKSEIIRTYLNIMLSKQSDSDKIVNKLGLNRMKAKTIISPVVYLSYKEDIKETIDMAEIKVPKKVEFVRNLTEESLLIVDNVDEMFTSEWVDFISKLRCKVIIISSRYMDCSQLGWVNLEMPVVNEEKSVEIFSAYLEQCSDKFDYNQKKSIAYDCLQGHILAIILYAKSIKQSILSYDQIISILKKNTISSKISEKVYADLRYSCKEETAKSNLIKLFDDDVLNVEDDDKYVMRVMSLMPRDGADCQRIQLYSGMDNNNAINEMLRKKWCDNVNGKIVMHSIVKDIIIELLKPDTLNCETMIKQVISEIKDSSYLLSNSNLCLIKIIDSIIDRIEFIESSNIDKVYWYFENFLRGTMSENCLERLIEKRNKYSCKNNVSRFCKNNMDFDSFMDDFDDFLSSNILNSQISKYNLNIFAYMVSHVIYRMHKEDVIIEDFYGLQMLKSYVQNIYTGFDIIFPYNTNCKYYLHIPDGLSESDYSTIKNIVLLYAEYENLALKSLNKSYLIDLFEVIMREFEKTGLSYEYLFVMGYYHQICSECNLLNKIKDEADRFMSIYGNGLNIEELPELALAILSLYKIEPYDSK